MSDAGLFDDASTVIVPAEFQSSELHALYVNKAAVGERTREVIDLVKPDLLR